MKQTTVTAFAIISILTLTGCASNSISHSLAQIEQADNQAKAKTVNQALLTQIQALRTSQDNIEKTYTFTYRLHQKELNHADKATLAKLLSQKSHDIIISIAPANANNKLQQLNLSLERARMLRLYVGHFNKDITIKFAPKLSSDTINLAIGA